MLTLVAGVAQAPLARVAAEVCKVLRGAVGPLAEQEGLRRLQQTPVLVVAKARLLVDQQLARLALVGAALGAEHASAGIGSSAGESFGAGGPCRARGRVRQQTHVLTRLAGGGGGNGPWSFHEDAKRSSFLSASPEDLPMKRRPGAAGDLGQKPPTTRRAGRRSAARGKSGNGLARCQQRRSAWRG
uniref:Uncharacterized protein n=1 Tax=Ixodes ricinus TaxID=34613 RepID=A0A147BQQ5_IXORI